MPLAIYLKQGEPHDPGWQAWCLDLLGFATWAPNEAEVMAKLPAKLAEHANWLRRHDEPLPALRTDITVAERAHGDELLFGPDHQPARGEEIDLTLRLIGHSRRDLLGSVSRLPDQLLDWDPPYQHFPNWADWRTIRQVIRHIALCEVGYYLRWIGFDPITARQPPPDWRDLLEASRADTLRCLDSLKTAADRARLVEARGEAWSVRKVLRRLVWHELLHIKNIRRIIGKYETSQR